MSENPSWFEDEEAFELIIDFIQKQFQLEVIFLTNCNLKGDKLAKVLKTVNYMAGRNTLRKIYLNGCDFTEDEPCQELAKLLAYTHSCRYISVQD